MRSCPQTHTWPLTTDVYVCWDYSFPVLSSCKLNLSVRHRRGEATDPVATAARVCHRGARGNGALHRFRSQSSGGVAVSQSGTVPPDAEEGRGGVSAGRVSREEAGPSSAGVGIDPSGWGSSADLVQVSTSLPCDSGSFRGGGYSLLWLEGVLRRKVTLRKI